MDDFERDERDEDPMEALRKLFSELGIPDMGNPQASGLFQRLMNQQSLHLPADQVIWDAARQGARQRIASLGPDPSPTSRASRAIADCAHLAELWLSENTIFPPVALPPVAWSRADWIEATLPAWKSMVEPVAATLSDAVTQASTSRMDHDAPPELARLQSMFQPFMKNATDTMFGARVGDGLGRAATMVLTGTDLGLPLLPKPQVAILPTNVAGVDTDREGEGVSDQPLLMYCCLREAARQRLFADVSWISPQIIALVQHYAAETHIDTEALASAMENAMPAQISAEAMASFQTELTDIIFRPRPSDEQKAILGRLNTLLALVEGWVEHVVAVTASTWLPTHNALSETLRRHRAVTKPAESIVTAFIGMSLTLTDIRLASQFWSDVRDARGIEGRDDIWRHPDGMPTAAQIADPKSYLGNTAEPTDALDMELRKLLGE